jgi:hypothetical protein
MPADGDVAPPGPGVIQPLPASSPDRVCLSIASSPRLRGCNPLCYDTA